LIGFGCVGQGFYHLLKKSKLPEQIKFISIKNEFKARKVGHELITTNQYQMFQDSQIKTVIEAINNHEQSYNILKNSILNGKNFITASKKMVAYNLAEIIESNEKSSILYEASVAGSIPIIRNLDTYFDKQYTAHIRAIINGSSNYILTRLFNEKNNYDAALKKAQELGYAELDPTDDVGGYDAKFKAVILAAHGFGLLCHPNEVRNFGIQAIQSSDIKFAIENQLVIKLVATMIRDKDGIRFTVIPEFINKNNELSKCNNENNVVIVNNNTTDFLFHGAGAGSNPTGTAILADLTALKKGYKYQYHINDKLKINNDFNLKIYFSKKNLYEKITGKIISETSEYIVAELNYKNLIEMKLTDVFVAKINENNNE
jgi:homoserine dehydrogenase